MNIFVTDYCPVASAINLDDSRVIKMVLETTQILHMCIKQTDTTIPLYRPTHIKHPVVLWAKKNTRNTWWLYQHGVALLQEYSHRFGKIHACTDRLFLLPIAKAGLPFEWQNSARNKKLNLDFSHLPVVQGYREYLKVRWSTASRLKWTDRNPPNWR